MGYTDGDKLRVAKGIFVHDGDSSRGFAHGTAEAAIGGIFSCGRKSQIHRCLGSLEISVINMINIYGDGSKPWYLVNPKIAGKWMFIPLKMYL